MTTTSGNLLSDQDCRRIAAMLRNSHDLLRPVDPYRRISASIQDYGRWHNTSGQACPAYGCFAVTGDAIFDDDLTDYVEGTKPSSTFHRVYYLNGPLEVPADGYGRFQIKSRVRFISGSGNPATGEGWGPKPDSWYLWKNYPSIVDASGYFSYQPPTPEPTEEEPEPEAPDPIIYGRGTWHPINSLIGKVDGAFSASGNTIKIYAGAGGSEAEVSGWTVSAKIFQEYVSGMYPIGSNAKTECRFTNGIWYHRPAMDFTKVDDYDAGTGKHQYLKHIEGVLKWITRGVCE
jgi:hypothetical protein